MQPKGPQIEFAGYVPLPNNEQIQVFESTSGGSEAASGFDQFRTGGLLFTKQFLPLWFYLYQTGITQYKGGFETKKILTPPTPVSKLVGTSFLTDPNSIVRVVSFEALNLDGPITTEGFQLDIFSSALILQVEWKIAPLNRHKSRNNTSVSDTPKGACRTDGVKIGFYTSDDVRYNTTGNLFLICGDKGPAIFNTGTSGGASSVPNTMKGSFTCKSYSRMFVALDADVQVFLKVTSRRPKVYSFPTLSEGEVYTKYLRVQSKCGDTFRLPVFTYRLIAPDFIEIDKQPSELFSTTAAIIQAFMMLTSLTLMFWDEPVEEVPAGLQLQQVPPRVPYTIPETVSSQITRYIVHSPVTTSFEEDRTGTWSDDYIGLKLYGSRITPEILPVIEWSLTVDGPVPEGTILTIECQWKSGALWPIHARVNPLTGEVIGECSLILGLPRTNPITG